ncbi:MAG: acetolactate synthase small subunit [Deltaproteobacteria bacterium]|jgi:acetolactate synthase-1/3 small subunit|nr:acetolactate synthase small subunit [Deltaproteobacteria bacterium]
MKKILSILVRNRPGVLSHVAGLVTRRGYNVESIAAGPTENRAITRITLVVAGDEPILEQVAKQVGKLVDVISLEDLPLEEAMTGELAIITVNADRARRAEMLNLINLLGLTLTDIRDDSLSVMAAGTAKSVQMAISGLMPFGIRAMARTGLVALSRPLDPKSANEEDE